MKRVFVYQDDFEAETADSPANPVLLEKTPRASLQASSQASSSPGTPEGRSKGGKARWEGLTPEERRAITRKGGKARWGK
jgi:hypothetical protein